ncbi:MAG: hypothetical protein Greene041662_967 [Candidatus Peregrinibacteria bacterium Greene0416_62]|nr:MAG: hypothetical protein Greene041662_967 [Candidatus Peregrinibacteria bacterium Greene0416_62]
MSDLEIRSREAVLGDLAEHLHADGFQDSAVQQLRTAQFESFQLGLGQSVVELVRKYRADQILGRTMEIFNAAQSLPLSEREDLFRLIGDILRKGLLNNVHAMATGCTVKNFFRYRSVILQWITPEEYQSIIACSVQYYLKQNIFGPLSDFSLYAALYFSELRTELPDGENLAADILRTIQAMNRWVPLFATTPPESVYRMRSSIFLA